MDFTIIFGIVETAYFCSRFVFGRSKDDQCLRQGQPFPTMDVIVSKYSTCLYFLSSTLVCFNVELNQILNKPSVDFIFIAGGLD
jgi:hypothetical protein